PFRSRRREEQGPRSARPRGQGLLSSTGTLRALRKMALSPIPLSSFLSSLAPPQLIAQDHAHLRLSRLGPCVLMQFGSCLLGHRVLLLLNVGKPAFSFDVNRGPAVS